MTRDPRLTDTSIPAALNYPDMCRLIDKGLSTHDMVLTMKNKLDSLFYAFATVFPDAVESGVLTVVRLREQAVVDARFIRLTEDLDTAGDDADTDPQEK